MHRKAVSGALSGFAEFDRFWVKRGGKEETFRPQDACLSRPAVLYHRALKGELRPLTIEGAGMLAYQPEAEARFGPRFRFGLVCPRENQLCTCLLRSATNC
jgi:hypothetical protein